MKNFLQDARNRDLVLLAGAGGLDREITRVSVLDAPDGPRWLKGGELILTSTFLFQNNVDQLCLFCKQLIAYGASGFGLKMGRYLNAVPQRLIDLCDSNGLPLIAIPYSFVWTDVISVFYEMLHNLPQNEKYATLKSKMVNRLSTAAAQGLYQLGGSICSFFETPVLFLDSRWEKVTYSGPEDAEADCLRAAVQFMAQPSDAWVTERRNGRFYACHRCTLEKLGASYVLLCSDSPGILEDLQDILTNAHVISEADGLSLLSENELLAQILPTLMVGNPIARRLRENLEVQIKKNDGCYCVLYITDYTARETFQELKELIRAAGWNIGVYDICSPEKHSAVAVLRFYDRDHQYEATVKLRRLLWDLAEALPEPHNDHFYVGNIYRTYKYLERSRGEAGLAERYGSRLWPERRICHFEEVLPYDLLMNSDMLSTYVDEIEKLKLSSAGLAFDCMETLEAYLRCGSIKKASEKLFIHENTLRYRLKKIGAIICADFDDPVVQRSYVIRLNCWRLLQKGLHD